MEKVVVHLSSAYSYGTDLKFGADRRSLHSCTKVFVYIDNPLQLDIELLFQMLFRGARSMGYELGTVFVVGPQGDKELYKSKWGEFKGNPRPDAALNIRFIQKFHTIKIIQVRTWLANWFRSHDWYYGDHSDLIKCWKKCPSVASVAEPILE